MNKIIILGSGGHAKSCIDVVEKQKKFKILGIVEKIRSKEKKIMGYPILGEDRNLKEIRKKFKNILIGVGQIKNFKTRSDIFFKLKKLGFNFPIIISPTAYISKNSKIGEGTIIMHNVTVNTKVTIGSNCIINTNALLEHEVEVGKDTHISTGVIINGKSKIGNKSFIGSGSIIRDGIRIGHGCVIGMGQIIRKNVKNFQIIK